MWDWKIIDSVAKIKETICIKMIHLGTGVLGKKYREYGKWAGEGPIIHVRGKGRTVEKWQMWEEENHNVV